MKNDLVAIEKSKRGNALAILAQGDSREAERALCALAATEGDQAVAKLISQSSPITIGRIMADHDASSETILSYLATPEQITEMLVMRPAEWEALSKSGFDKAMDIQKMAFHLLVSLFFNRSPEDRTEILETIAEDEEAFAFLVFALCFLNTKDLPNKHLELARNTDDERDDYSASVDFGDNTPEMLYVWINEASPEIAEKIIMSLEEDHRGVLSIVRDLRQRAIEKIVPVDQNDEDDIFKPLT